MNLPISNGVDAAGNMLRFYSVQIAPTLLGASSGNGGGSARLVERQNWFASAGEAVAAGLMARREKERRGYRGAG